MAMDNSEIYDDIARGSTDSVKNDVKITYIDFMSALANSDTISAYEMWSTYGKRTSQWVDNINDNYGTVIFHQTPTEMIAKCGDVKLITLWYNLIGENTLSLFLTKLEAYNYENDVTVVINQLHKDYPMIIELIKARNIQGMVTLKTLIGQKLASFFFVYPIIGFGWLNGLIALTQQVPDFKLEFEQIDTYYQLCVTNENILFVQWFEDNYQVSDIDVETLGSNWDD